jgi:hypothetical protein
MNPVTFHFSDFDSGISFNPGSVFSNHIRSAVFDQRFSGRP